MQSERKFTERNTHNSGPARSLAGSIVESNLPDAVTRKPTYDLSVVWILSLRPNSTERRSIRRSPLQWTDAATSSSQMCNMPHRARCHAPSSERKLKSGLQHWQVRLARTRRAGSRAGAQRISRHDYAAITGQAGTKSSTSLVDPCSLRAAALRDRVHDFLPSIFTSAAGWPKITRATNW
jgi:hypothetical protein